MLRPSHVRQSFWLLFVNILVVGVASLTAPTSSSSSIKTFHFGAGCFWAPEDNIKNEPGIISSSVGYCGDDDTKFTSIPTYEKVCGGRTNLVEAVRVEYDSNQLSYQDMLGLFAKVNTAEWANKRQYRGIIFTMNPEESKAASVFLKENEDVVAEIEPMSQTFYTAEKYHQDYWAKWRSRGAGVLGVLCLVGTPYCGDLLGVDVSQKLYNGIIWGFVLFTLVERRFFYDQKVITVGKEITL